MIKKRKENGKSHIAAQPKDIEYPGWLNGELALLLLYNSCAMNDNVTVT